MVNVDIIANGVAYGDVAQRLLNANMDPGVLRPYIAEDGKAYVTVNGSQMIPVANATLRKDEWKQYDDAILKVAKERLVGIADLRTRGLTYRFNGMAKTVLEYETMSDPGEAQVSMDGIARGDADRPNYELAYLPLPITHSDFFLNARVINASRQTGAPLDTTMAEAATRRVNEKLEQMLFSNLTFSFGGGTIYSYINFPHRNTVSLSTSWTDSSKTAAQIIADVESMIQAAVDANMYGPYVLYIPKTYALKVQEDYTTQGGGKTIKQRILEFDGVEDVKVAPYLPDDNVVLVQMTSDVVRLVIGLDVTPVEWKSEGGLVYHMKVMTIQVPQIRADQNGQCGIVHLA